jgi:hypothetical protein
MHLWNREQAAAAQTGRLEAEVCYCSIYGSALDPRGQLHASVRSRGSTLLSGSPVDDFREN